MPGLPTGLCRSQVSSLACPGSQHGFGPNLGFMFGMPALSTGLWPEAGFQTWHARALNMALARTWVSSLACPGFQHQHGFGANAGFKFGMPGLTTGLACPGSQQGFGPKPGFKSGMPGLPTWLWPESGFHVWHARALNRALARSRISSLACPGSQHGFGPNLGFKFGMPGLSTSTWLWSELGFQVWHARAFNINMALVRMQVSSLACPGSQHGFGPNLGFKFGMPGLSTSTWLWCECRFQVWHARALNRFGMPGLPTGLWPEAGFQVWRARALARSRISGLACPGSQHGFGPNSGFKFGMPGLPTWLWPEPGFHVWHARALNRALARSRISSLACPGSQHGFGPNLGFKFGMPGLSTSTWLWCERRFQVWHARALNRFGMPGLPTGLWPEAGFQVWHARVPYLALARTWVSCLACPGSQPGFGPKPDFKFGMPGLSTWLWPELGFQSLACPGFQLQHGFGANAGFKFGMPGLSTGLACPGSQQGFGPKPGFKFGMPGLPTWLWPEPGFHVWHARTWVSSLACPGFQHQHGFGPNLGFKFGMPGLSTSTWLWCECRFQVWHVRALNRFGMPGLPTGLWPEAGFQVWHARTPEPGFHVWHARALNRALARSRISSLACPGSQHGFGPNLDFKFGMPGLSTSTWLWCERRFQVWHARALNRFGMPGLPTGLWPEAGFQVWHARAPNMALARTWVSCLACRALNRALARSRISSLACPGSQHGFGPNLGFKFGMPGLSTSTWLWCERRFQVWHARALNRFGMAGSQQGFGPKPGFKFGMPGLSTWLWPEPGFHVWHARALNRALARSRISSLACPGSQHGFGPNLGFKFGMPGLSWLWCERRFQVWHARALNMALARTWVSSLACPGFQHQHGFGANAGFKFGMPGLSTGLACPGSQQGFGPKPDFKFGMPGLSTWLWPELGFQVWHARAFNINMALVRTQVSSLACPGSQ